MTVEKTVNQKKVRLEIIDITDFEIEAFVYYAREDLELGAGFGTCISLRGGPSVQEELKKIGSVKPLESVITDAGEMKAKYIVHAAGPKFQEEDTESKLAATIRNALKEADKKGIAQIALPAMGAGFYGAPIETSAKITVDSVKQYLQNSANIKEVVLCMIDSKQYKAFQQELNKIS